MRTRRIATSLKMAASSVVLSFLFVPILGASKYSLVERNPGDSAAPGAEGRQQNVSDPQPRSFTPAGVSSASDVQYPLDTTADGIIVFSVSLNARGTITNINTLADTPPLTAVARSSLQSWKFSPASLRGTPEPSKMMVAFVFRHAVKIWNPPAFNPVFASTEQSGYMPPGIFSATYAEYPPSTVAAGATVVQVTVGADGAVGNVKIVRPMSGGFVPLAVRAARNWQFQPAVRNGTPVTSNVAIAFVFSSRVLNPF